jgi:hypothetical protein
MSEEEEMSIHPLAGKPAPAAVLIDIDEIEKAYYERKARVEMGVFGVPIKTASFYACSRQRSLRRQDATPGNGTKR